MDNYLLHLIRFLGYDLTIITFVGCIMGIAFLVLISSIQDSSDLSCILKVIMGLTWGVGLVIVCVLSKNLLFGGSTVYNIFGDRFTVLKEMEQVEVGFLPNQTINLKINTFLVDGRAVEYQISKDVRFIDEDIDQPYIILEKYSVSYKEPIKGFAWKIPESWKKRIIEGTKKSVVTEIHY